MGPLSCTRCAQGALELFEDSSGAELLFCARCRSTFCRGEQVARWLGGELPASSSMLGLPPLNAAAPACPTRDGGTLHALPVADVHAGAYRCTHCGALLLEAGVLPAVRKLFGAPTREARLGPRSMRAPAAPELRSMRPEASESPPYEGGLHGDRLAFREPSIDLLALPLALLLSFLVSSSGFGRLLLYPVQIQFHELGHALVAWLSSRAALPLPFGFTFWREEPSRFTGLCMLFLLGVLVYYGMRERRRFAVVLGAALLVAFAVLSWFTPIDRSRMYILLSGILGELTLTTLVMVGFYFPMPDRLRWDFFRFVALLPAASAWMASARLWLGVAAGTRAMPMGSIVGTAGDGSGDLDRLMAHYHFTAAELTRFYVGAVTLTALCLGATYAWFALRALAELRAKQHTSS